MPDIVDAVREVGGCGVTDGVAVCVRDANHGPHGFDPDIAAELHAWKQVAAKLAVMVVRFDNPDALQDDVEHHAGNFLHACLASEREAIVCLSD